MRLQRILFFSALAATFFIGLAVFQAVLSIFPEDGSSGTSAVDDRAIVKEQDYLFERLSPLMDRLPAAPLKKDYFARSRYDVPFGILMYHHIGNDPRFTARGLSVTPQNLEKQISFLIERGYHFLTLGQAFEYFGRDGAAPMRTVVMTFDDGYRSFYTAVFPLLKKYQVPASVYVINQDVGKRGNLTWGMLQELAKSGLVEIGAHTVNHRSLKKMTDQEQRFQLSESKRQIEDRLGIPVTTVVYPFGTYNATTTRLARELGFAGAASVYFGKRPAKDHLYDWRRVQVQNKDQGEALLKLLYGAFVVVK